MTVDINVYEGFVSTTWAQLGQGRMGHIPPFSDWEMQIITLY